MKFEAFEHRDRLLPGFSLADCLRRLGRTSIGLYHVTAMETSGIYKDCSGHMADIHQCHYYEHSKGGIIDHAKTQASSIERQMMIQR